MHKQPVVKIPHQVVRASAGAGKTYQLTTRYLKLLSLGEPPAQILATTFTRKAAGEVLARVLGRLSSACVDDAARVELEAALALPPGQTLSQDDCIQMLRGMTSNLQRLSIGTIDGFFNRAARALGLELGLPPEARLIDEGSAFARQMRADAIQAGLDEQVQGDDGLATLIEMLRRLHHDTAERKVADAIDQIVTDLLEVYRSHPDPALWDALPETGMLSPELLAAATQVLHGMQDAIPVTKKGTPIKHWANAYSKLLADIDRGNWEGLLANGLIGKILQEEAKFSGAEITDDWQRAIHPLLVHAKAQRIKVLADQTRATHSLLAWFDRHYRAIRWRRRALLFSDLTHLLADGLPTVGDATPTAGIDELSYRLDTRVTHLLLDEFQDTSLRQWDVLRPFAEQITDNFEDSRSFYCVGDTKQAIYGWRGGCAQLFDAVETELPGIETTTLSKSWRSSQVVLDAVNQVFGSLTQNAALDKAAQAASDWQENFTQHLAVKTELPGHVILQTTAVNSVDDASSDADDEDDDATAPPDAHAHHVAQHIQGMLRHLPGKTIGVLMRSRSKAATLMHALRGLGVDAAEEGGNPIANTPAVAAVLAAVRLSDHPGDTVARFHVMNSPIGQVLGYTTDSGASATQDVLKAIARRVRRELIDHGYAAVLADWTRALAPSCDVKSLRRLEQLVGLAEQYDEYDATLRPGFFVQAVQSMRVEDASPAPVRVMTIHASKGLEFDAVVLPDLDGTLSQSDSKALVMLNRDSPIAPVRAVYRRVKEAQAALLPELQQAYDQYAYEKRTEDLCLLYVAMTRARQSLHLLVRPLKQGKTGKANATGLDNLSYAAILRQALRTDDDEGFEGNDLLYESGDPGWARKDAVVRQSAEQEHADAKPADSHTFVPIRLAKQTGASRRSWALTTPSQMHQAGTVSAQDLLRMSDAGGRNYGSLIHKLFEQVAFLDETTPDPDDLKRSAASFASQSAGGDVDAALAQFQQAIQQPALVDLLSRHGADELWRERPFAAHLDNQLVRGIFDRVHLWREGSSITRVLLIDFKTDRVTDETIDTVAEDYAEQLGLYRKALSSLLGLDLSCIEAKLCFTGDARVQSVD